MAESEFDIAVIGGGIHGAGVAQAAQAAGYSCALIEKKNWAAGTSSKSSKLIHGGLRYLETAQIPLVWHSLSERRTLLKIAPQLVKPLRFNIPVYPRTRRRPWQLFIGLCLYALLAGLTPLARFNALSGAQRKALSALCQDKLQAVFSYWDAQTDDAKLTAAVVKSAQQLGAQLFCPAAVTEVTATTTTNEQYLLQIEGRDTVLRCRAIVNAAGPWANELLASFKPAIAPISIDWVKGSHLVIAEKVSAEAYYLEAVDGRAVFLLPWGEHSLLGTTEEVFRGNPDDVRVSAAEVDYLLATFKAYFPAIEPTVVDQFAGLRVLPISSDKPFTRPRECVLHIDPSAPAVVTLYGGKLTSYRHTSAQVIELLQSTLGKRRAVADTRTLPLAT